MQVLPLGWRIVTGHPEPPAARPRIEVVAAIVSDAGRFLVTRRLRGTHLEGCWEFPGGKVDPGESHAEALRREMLEELGVGIDVGPLELETSHAYPDRVIVLAFYHCRLLGEPTPLLGQEMQWVDGPALPTLEFPPADAELITRLATSAAPRPSPA